MPTIPSTPAIMPRTMNTSSTGMPDFEEIREPKIALTMTSATNTSAMFRSMPQE